MNSGGEPERDDTGLPPVHIEIPDDARELDRDVQAYYRELRAERRRLRHRRVRSMVVRDGIVLPLLACCLILALITGTLLTIFSATSDQNLTRVPGSAASGPRTSGSASGPVAPQRASSGAASHAASSGPGPAVSNGALAPNHPVVVPTGRPLPVGTLSLAGKDHTVPLRGLSDSVLVLVPPACQCGAAVSWLANIGNDRGARTYLVGTPQTISEVRQLHSRLSAKLRASVTVAFDKQSVLSNRYGVRGVTAVLVVGPPLQAQSAAYAHHLSAKDDPAGLVQALSGAG